MIKDENYNYNETTEEEIVTIPLELENGSIVNCHVIAIFDWGGMDYIALLPEETDEILLFRYTELQNDEIQIENIESDWEWERVVDYFDSMLKEDEE